MTTVAPAQQTPPVRPATSRPLWERHKLFQEPAYAEGLALEVEDDEDGDG
jgi:hypothetical protein